MDPIKSPKLPALENTLEILGQQREHAIFILESRIEEPDAPASLFSVHRNFLRDHEAFLRAQIKAVADAPFDFQTFLAQNFPSPEITPPSEVTPPPSPESATTPTTSPDDDTAAQPCHAYDSPSASPLKTSPLATAFSLLLLLFLPSFTSACYFSPVCHTATSSVCQTSASAACHVSTGTVRHTSSARRRNVPNAQPPTSLTNIFPASFSRISQYHPLWPHPIA
jgi:hypothetical protein